MPRPFRFAVQVHLAGSGASWARKARRVEELGYDALVIVDHMHLQLSPITSLTAAALATERIRLSAFVFANDYRHPLLLARELATLDVISRGRIDIALGAGWSRPDYRALGIAYDRPGVRVDRMIEAVRLMKRLWAGEKVDHDGRHYRVRGAELAPTPVQKPFPPLMIGGGGPRILGFAAREADIVALAPRVDERGRPRLTDIGAAGTSRKVARVREAAGARWERLELNAIVFDADVTGRARSLAGTALANAKAVGLRMLDTPFFMAGSIDGMRRDLVRRNERYGISYITIPERAMDAFAPVARELAGR